MTIIFLVIWL